jgi:hypothetical protein
MSHEQCSGRINTKAIYWRVCINIDNFMVFGVRGEIGLKKNLSDFWWGSSNLSTSGDNKWAQISFPTKKRPQSRQSRDEVPATYIDIFEIEKIKKGMILKEIDDRLAVLDTALEEDQDRDLYERTKRLFLEVIIYLKIDRRPLIGANDTGQVVAEWQDYKTYDIVALRCETEESIILHGSIKGGGVFRVKTKLELIKRYGNEAFSLKF